MWTENESYMHRRAKDLLFEWLCDVEAGGPEIHPFYWRRGNYGVHKELRVFETSDLYYFENSGGLRWPAEKPYDWVTSFEPGFDRGRILFAPDICIFHKGQMKLLVEVVYTHCAQEEKFETIRRFAKGQELFFYEVDAEEILRQTKRPDSLQIMNYVHIH